MIGTSDSARYRSTCEDTILQDFQLALDKEIENRLWDVHGKTNNRFRKELKHVCDASFCLSRLSMKLTTWTVSRTWKKEAGRTAQDGETLPRFHQVKPAILPRIHSENRGMLQWNP